MPFAGKAGQQAARRGHHLGFIQQTRDIGGKGRSFSRTGSQHQYRGRRGEGGFRRRVMKKGEMSHRRISSLPVSSFMERRNSSIRAARGEGFHDAFCPQRRRTEQGVRVGAVQKQIQSLTGCGAGGNGGFQPARVAGRRPPRTSGQDAPFPAGAACMGMPQPLLPA